MKKQSRSSKPTPPAGSPQTFPTTDAQGWIRRRAYELYEQQGRQEGHELEHWLQAEAELASLSKTTRP